MQRPKTNLKTQGIQSSERHTCSGHNAQTNDYFTTNLTVDVIIEGLSYIEVMMT